MPLLPGGETHRFPILNREMLPDSSLDIESFKKYYRAQPDEKFLACLSDINVLYFLYTNETLSFKEVMKDICTAIKKKDTALEEEFKVSPMWATFEQIIAVDSVLTSGETWSCGTCTLINNASKTTCEVCGTPKS